MLTDFCAEIRNYFLRDYRADIHAGTFTVSDGHIESLSFLQDGQYFRIKNSVFNDGVWKYGEEAETLHDETFEGEIWAMAVPPDAVALSEEIDQWITANADSLNSPYQSESFGGYSYSKSSGRSNANGSSNAYGWQDHFASRLNKYRRVSVL